MEKVCLSTQAYCQLVEKFAVVGWICAVVFGLLAVVTGVILLVSLFRWLFDRL